MKKYQSFGALAKALERLSERLPLTLEVAMAASALVVEAAAKDEIGHYQREDTGPFSAWEELKPATKADRLQQGFTENDPLLRTGELYGSIEHQSDFRSFVVGSTSEIMVYQELGTPKGIPPRPVLAVALYRNIETVLNIVGRTIERTLTGKE